jgi:hypothetical protein
MLRGGTFHHLLSPAMLNSPVKSRFLRRPQLLTRRTIRLLLIFACLMAPLAPEAQPPTYVHRIGALLGLGTTPGGDLFVEAFLQTASYLKRNGISTSWTDGSERSNATNKVGKGVVEALSAEGKVFVLIALERPGAPLTDLPVLRQETADLQESVLSELSPTEFRLVQRYETIPSLSGWVLNEEGLAKLAIHPHVVRIDLDVGGGGG